MSVFTAWLVFPALMVLLATGLGLLIERLTGRQVPVLLLPGLGMAALIVVMQVVLVSFRGTEIAVPVVLALAAAGLMLDGGRLLRRHPDPWGAVSAVAVVCVFAAPIVLSGDATFGGYVKLDDTASWLGITDRIFEHGYDLDGLAPSTYEAMLDFYLASDYPVAVFAPLGLGHDLLGTDIAWLYQPYLALFAGLLALTLFELARRSVESTRARALFVFVAAQPALLYGFYLWGGIKEMAAAWCLALMAALVPGATEAGGRSNVVPLAVVTAAMLAILSVGGGVWVGPVLAVALIALVARQGARVALRQSLIFAAVAIPLSLPQLLAFGFLSAPASSTDTLELRLANLFEPLSPLQAFGIWPVEDFRLRPDAELVTYVLVGVSALLLAYGAAGLWARRSRELALLTYVVAAGSVRSWWQRRIRLGSTPRPWQPPRRPSCWVLSSEPGPWGPGQPRSGRALGGRPPRWGGVVERPWLPRGQPRPEGEAP